VVSSSLTYYILCLPSHLEEGMMTQIGTLRTFEVRNSSRLSLDVQAFLLDAQARNVSPGTLRFYSQKLYPLIAYLEQLKLREAEEVTASHLRLWLVHLQQTGHNPGGVHGFYRAAKALFMWLLREGTIVKSPMALVRAPKVPEEPLEPVTLEQIRALLAVCATKSELDTRDKAVILCLWDSGCRASEFVSLTYGDIDLQSGTLMIRSGKGRKPRVTFLGAKSRRELMRYLRIRGELALSDPLFASDKGKELRYESLRDILRRRAKEAGIEAPTLHSFRRGFALDSLRNGADVYSLQRLMGHADLSVLRRYLKQTDVDLQRVHEKTGPVDRLL
jgi:site-specific recombinase XerD